MKERPILFSGPMVRAILEGRKTQTRRIVKPQPLRDHGVMAFNDGEHPQMKCPYGKPGDRLWVREMHYVQSAPGPGHTGFILYKATDNLAPVSKWRPSIHMPRWASRITLEVVSVRVERLQEISEEDARSEGVGVAAGLGQCRGLFRNLCQSINGPGSWDANPWVWAVEFKCIVP